jgi:hypothetical protein
VEHNETYVRKVERNIDDFLLMCRRRPKLAALLVIIAICWTIFQWRRVENLKEQVAELERQLGPFRSAAAVWFPGDVKEGLKRLGDKITKLESDQEDQLRYAHVAKYEFNGDVSTGGMFTGGPLSGWTKQYVVDVGGGKTNYDCNPEAISYYLSILEKHPDFPYPYYPVAMCYLATNKKEWKEYALKGVAIAEKIVKVPGHVVAYDELLGRLKEMLEKNPGN